MAVGFRGEKTCSDRPTDRPTELVETDTYPRALTCIFVFVSSIILSVSMLIILRAPSGASCVCVSYVRRDYGRERVRCCVVLRFSTRECGVRIVAGKSETAPSKRGTRDGANDRDDDHRTVHRSIRTTTQHHGRHKTTATRTLTSPRHTQEVGATFQHQPQPVTKTVSFVAASVAEESVLEDARLPYLLSHSTSSLRRISERTADCAIFASIVTQSSS